MGKVIELKKTEEKKKPLQPKVMMAVVLNHKK